MLEIIIALIGVLIPLLWVRLEKRLKDLSKDNELLSKFLIAASKELEALYSVVFEKVKEVAKDGQISEEEKEQLIKFALEKAKEKGINLFSIAAPEVYKYVLQKMIENALKG